MGQHRQVLEIYVFKLEDHDKAEEYVMSLWGYWPLLIHAGTATMSI